MRITRPAYYDRFVCAAGNCPDSCCKEWVVDIDAETARKYMLLPGKIGEDLRRVLQETDDGYVLEITQEGRCPMWRADGLCRIQGELGESALSHVCSTFPRLTHDYGSFREKQLELSCPVAAELIFSGESGMLFEEADFPEEAEDYDPGEMEILRSAREQLTRLLQDPSIPVQQALIQVVRGAAAVQERIDGESVEILPEKAHPEEILGFFETLEILNPAWLERLRSAKPGPWEDCLRHGAVYFLSRYLLQAVSDGDAAGRILFAVLSCLVIHLLGGDPVQTAQQYSKEIENDPDNMEAILDGLSFEKCLSAGHLIACLMESMEEKCRI